MLPAGRRQSNSEICLEDCQHQQRSCPQRKLFDTPGFDRARAGWGQGKSAPQASPRACAPGLGERGGLSAGPRNALPRPRGTAPSVGLLSNTWRLQLRRRERLTRHLRRLGSMGDKKHHPGGHVAADNQPFVNPADLIHPEWSL